MARGLSTLLPALPGLPALLGLPVLLGLAACGPEEPVLQGVPAEALLADQPSARQRAASADPSSRSPEEPYRKAEGVYVDVLYLGGASFRLNRDLLTDQLGALQGVEDLPDGAQRASFERGQVQVKDDTIYQISVPLPQPLRRSEALNALGFPAYVGRYVSLHREYRLNNTWGFRRLRLKRQSADNELVTEIEAWHSIPDAPDVIR